MTKTTHSELRQSRIKARVQAKQLAQQLAIDSASVARFELYGAPLPHGLTATDYRAALHKLTAAGASK